MGYFILVILVLVVIYFSQTKTPTGGKTKKNGTPYTQSGSASVYGANGLRCSFRSNGSYSSILNRLEQDVYLLATQTRGYGELSVVVSVRKMNSNYCRVSGSFLADGTLSGARFDSGYQFNGTDSVKFETSSATGFTSVEDVKREMLLQFDWNDLPVYNPQFTVLAHGDFVTTPYISYSFTVKR